MVSMRKLAGGAGLTALAMVLSTAAYAQETTGGVRGQITNSAGAPIANVTVVVTNTSQNTSSTTVTNASGAYDVRNLTPGGPYVLTAKGSAGEKTVQIGDIGLGAPLLLNFTLGEEAGAVSEVVVTASRAGPKETLTGPRSTFTAKDVEALPSFQRDLKDLARRNPFVTLDPTNANALIIAGANNRVSTVYIDGVKQADDFGLNQNGYPSQRSPLSTDWVSQFNLEVAPYDVQYGAFEGGVMNIVTKSGGNQFHGSIYGEYDSNRMAGTDFTGYAIDPKTGLKASSGKIKAFEDRTWGVTLSGPIIKDKLFFFAGYEDFQNTSPAGGFGPSDSSEANKIPGITVADVTNVQGILKSVYNFDPLGYSSGPIQTTDKKYFGKLEWNITDRQRAVVEYQRDEGVSLSNGGSNSTSSTAGQLALLSQYYNLNQTLEVYSGHLYSQWTDNLSTTLEYSHKEVSSIRAPLAGNSFAQFQVKLATGASIVLGPDISSQGNILDNKTDAYKFKVNYKLGDHVFSAGYEREDLSVFNEFVQNATGAYVFDNTCGLKDAIKNLQSRQACSLTYANAADNVTAHGAASWDSSTNALFFQDEFTPIPELILRAGVRAEWYTDGTVPVLNQRFLNQYGFANTANFDGMHIIMPRFGFNWRPDPTLTVTGGFGLFSGGNPNVWLSNSYTNTGNLLGSASCKPTGSNCGAALTGVDGFNINPAALAANTASTLTGTGVTNALDPNFRPPSVWKASIGVVKVFDLPYVGDNWRVHGDYLYQEAKDAVTWVDLWAIQNPGAPAPDGRPTYNVGRFTNSLGRTTGYDLMLTNDKKGGGTVWALGVGKDWNDGWAKGLGFDVTYTHSDVKEANPGTSSVALSNYSQWAISSRNNPQLAVSNYNIEYQTKITASYTRAFFGDNKTTINLFAQRRAGLPFSYTFQQITPTGTTLTSGAAYDYMFGESGSVGYRNTELLYVPKTDSTGNITATSDPIIKYANGFDVAGFNNFLKQTGLINYSGQIAPRNAFKSRDITTIDVRLTQELPAFFPGGAKLKAYIDIINLGNLINKKWGILEQYGFPYTYGAVQARNCQYSASACQTGVGNFYQYDKLSTQNPTVSVSNQSSTWFIKVGLKYQF